MHTMLAFLMQFPAIGLFVLLVLGGIGFPFPEDGTLILCGFLLSQQVAHPVPALVMVYLGLLCADTIVYHIGKKYGRLIVTHRRFRRFLSSEKFAELEKQFDQKGALFILIGRHVFGLRIQIFLVAGIMRMQYLKFVLSDAVSALFTLSVMVGIGYLGGNSWQILRKDFSRIEHIIVLVLLTGVTIYLLVKYFRARKVNSSSS